VDNTKNKKTSETDKRVAEKVQNAGKTAKRASRNVEIV